MQEPWLTHYSEQSFSHQLHQLKQHDWITTNGLGGYAASTMLHLNTRRYHGLLVAALDPPVSRMILVNGMEETVKFENQSIDLSLHQYPDFFYPRGDHYLCQFEMTFHPAFTYHFQKKELQKKIWMEHGKNRTFVHYHYISGTSPIELQLSPFLNYRKMHALQHAHPSQFYNIQPYANQALHIQAHHQAHPYWMAWSQGTFQTDRQWYYNVEYFREQDRGLDFSEDVFCPGSLSVTLQPGETMTILFSAEPESDPVQTIHQAPDLYKKLTSSKAALLSQAGIDPSNQPLSQMIQAADDFIVKRNSTQSSSIIAGYFWFADWGRDSMIALPGLTLSTGRTVLAKSILQTFAAHLYEGLIPNNFSDYQKTPEYNTVDGTLWFVIALYKYYQTTHDQDFVKSIFPVIEKIILKHFEGTMFNIHADPNGLLEAGEAGIQLTWMDSKIGNWVVTPRHGKPVEINALWINVLTIYQEWQRHLDLTNKIRIDLDELMHHYNSLFWNKEKNCLFDVVGDENKDDSIRPNQLIALSLPFDILPLQHAKAVLHCIDHHLLTPFGLRTLSPDDPDYEPVYRGSPFNRDKAYHQGTVWPWLLGHYWLARIKLYGINKQSLQQMHDGLHPLLQQLKTYGIGHVAEVYDGQKPHHPNGCPMQAWSLATLLEVLSLAENWKKQ